MSIYLATATRNQITKTYIDGQPTKTYSRASTLREVTTQLARAIDKEQEGTGTGTEQEQLSQQASRERKIKLDTLEVGMSKVHFASRVGPDCYHYVEYESEEPP